ncbi:MAG: leucine-rich repeat protein [Oscillospiraceae bacterium]|nr:leucine-rich repeat protein [Oscillospiraceae bacterium]
MKIKLCIIISTFVIISVAAKVSALDITDNKADDNYIQYNGKSYKPAYDNDNNWLGYYLDENGYVSYMSMNNYMHTEYPYPNDSTHPEVRYGFYDGYDLFVSRGRQPAYIGWLSLPHEKRMVRNPHYSIKWWKESEPRYDYSIARIRIPSSITDELNKTCGYVCSIEGSCAFKEFDLDPESEYMKCVDNVIFSKDGKTLMSYAQYDERSEYSVPSDTEVIEDSSFYGCKNLKKVCIPETVTEIKEYAFNDTVNLYEINMSSFDIKIDRRVFGYGAKPNARLTSGVQTKVSADEITLNWKEINNSAYYEIYQKQSSGEYTLLGKTKSTSHTFGSLKPGAKYTFAVKPIAVIPAANYDKEKDEGEYPETFTIEGTMSEDVVVKG